ncbi:MAG TPA: NlpC/P60 family protein [Mycobacteriales bacterium]
MPLALVLAGSGQAAPTITIAEAQTQLSALQAREGAAAEAYDAGMIAANAAAAKAKAAQAAVDAQSAKLASLERGIQTFAVASYMSAGTDNIDALLAGGDPQVLVQRAAAMNQIARSHSSQLLAIRAQREMLTGAQQVASDQAEAAAAAAKQLAAAKASIDAIIAQEQQVLSHLQAKQRAELVAQQSAEQAASRSQARTALSGPTSAGPVPPASGAAEVALQAAYSQLGKPYQYGAAGPNAYDCSGLTMWAFARAGISLPHSAAGQMGRGTPVPRSQLEPGDLVFFNGGGHVGIYVGNGKMIDANHTGGWVGVRPLYGGYDGARRL